MLQAAGDLVHGSNTTVDVPLTFVPPPPGYALWNLGAGGTLLVGSQVFILDASLRNVFDTAFRSFMSRYKEFANGPGRALVLGVTTEF